MFWIFGFIAFFLAALFLVDYLISAPVYKGPKSGHFDGKRFGISGVHKARGLVDVIKWSVNRNRGEWTKITKNKYVDRPEQQADNGRMRVTFVNHSTFLLQLDKLNILTDPVWSERASPYSWIGPKRMRPPGIRFDDLPEIHAVLISHNHYDHLDIPTVMRLNEKFSPQFITPLGVGQFLHQKKIKRTDDLDWWDEININPKTKVTAVPARHFSGRGIFDRDKTLWCGFVVQSSSGTIYFAGDTAYGDFFPEIGERFSPVDLALIPVGAYRPRWFMRPIHCNPDEAVQIHRDVVARKSIATHFGAFPLADDGMHEPLKDLDEARKKYEVLDTDFFALKEGEQKSFTAPKIGDTLIL